MMRKFTKTEQVVVLDKKDQEKIAKGLAKTGSRALHELSDKEREELLRDVKEK